MRGVVGLLALLLVLAAVPAAAGPGNSPDAPPGRDGKDDKEKAHRPSSIGDFTLAQQTVTGEFVQMRFEESAIRGYSVKGISLFDATIVGTAPGGASTGAKADGAQVRVRTTAYDLRAHDNPEGVTRIETNGAITVTLAPGTLLEREGQKAATFTLGNLTGTIRGDSLAFSGRVVTATDRLLVFVDHPHGDFDVHRKAIGKAIAKGHVGAEASFNKRDGGIQQDVISYGDVTMTTLKAETGNLTLLVDGHGAEGRVLVLNVDGRVIGADRSDKLVILVDNESAQHEPNLTALLDPDADGIKPVYHVVFDPSAEAFQVLVRVPHYSVHTLSVTTLVDIVPPSVIIGIVAGVALLVPSALLLFRRKRE